MLKVFLNLEISRGGVSVVKDRFKGNNLLIEIYRGISMSDSSICRSPMPRASLSFDLT